MRTRTLFVDKLEDFDLGGYTKDKRKIEYIFASYGMSFEKILNEAPKTSKIVAGAFHSGRYVVFYSMDWDLKNAVLGFVNYKVDLVENFDLFADVFSPKAVQGFHDLKEIIKKKSELELNKIKLSDDSSEFEMAYNSYIEFVNR